MKKKNVKQITMSENGKETRKAEDKDQSEIAIRKCWEIWQQKVFSGTVKTFSDIILSSFSCALRLWYAIFVWLCVLLCVGTAFVCTALAVLGLVLQCILAGSCNGWKVQIIVVNRSQKKLLAGISAKLTYTHIWITLYIIYIYYIESHICLRRNKWK